MSEGTSEFLIKSLDFILWCSESQKCTSSAILSELAWTLCASVWVSKLPRRLSQLRWRTCRKLVMYLAQEPFIISSQPILGTIELRMSTSMMLSSTCPSLMRLYSFGVRSFPNRSTRLWYYVELPMIWKTAEVISIEISGPSNSTRARNNMKSVSAQVRQPILSALMRFPLRRTVKLRYICEIKVLSHLWHLSWYLGAVILQDVGVPPGVCRMEHPVGEADWGSQFLGVENRKRENEIGFGEQMWLFGLILKVCFRHTAQHFCKRRDTEAHGHKVY